MNFKLKSGSSAYVLAAFQKVALAPKWQKRVYFDQLLKSGKWSLFHMLPA